MGLWVQNIGVAAPLPQALAALADPDGAWLPDPPLAGWSWTSLRDMHDFAVLDALVVDAAAEAGAPALAFSVHDEESVYLVAAGPTGGTCRLALVPEELEHPDAAVLADGRAVQRFADWAAAWAPEPIGAAAIDEFVESGDVLGLLAAVGLSEQRAGVATDWYPSDMMGVGPRDDEELELLGERAYAVLPEPVTPSEGPPGPWILIAAHDRLAALYGPDEVSLTLTFVTEDDRYFLGPFFGSVDAARAAVGDRYLGRRVEGWHAVPDDVGRSPAATFAWIRERI